MSGNLFDREKLQNPLARLLYNNFHLNVFKRVKQIKPRTILDYGCGEGFFVPIIKELLPQCEYTAADIDEKLLDLATQKGADKTVNLSAKNNVADSSCSYDLVMALEVLEHLQDLDSCLETLQKVADDYLLITVPWEPFFRISNMLSMKYLKNFGNTPGHIHHWNKKTLSKLLREYFTIEDMVIAYPWILAVCRNSKKEKC